MELCTLDSCHDSECRGAATATCNAAVSVVNALATGEGAAIGIAVRSKVSALLLERPKGEPCRGKPAYAVQSAVEDRHRLLETCAAETLKFLRQRLADGEAISLIVESDIPPAVGLKSSSSLSVATVSAVAKLVSEALGKRALGDGEILKISCAVSRRTGVSITGAYDDATACMLGGYVVTDNRRRRIVGHSRTDRSLGATVVVRIPAGETKFTSSIEPKKNYSKFIREVSKAFEFARQGKVPEAVVLNSVVQCLALGYSFAPIEVAMQAGAVAAGVSGKGPAVAAFCRGEKIGDRVEKAWKDSSRGRDIKVLRSSIVQPTKILPSGLSLAL